jgi:hypothetical protein
MTCNGSQIAWLDQAHFLPIYQLIRTVTASIQLLESLPSVAETHPYVYNKCLLKNTCILSIFSSTD